MNYPCPSRVRLDKKPNIRPSILVPLIYSVIYVVIAHTKLWENSASVLGLCWPCVRMLLEIVVRFALLLGLRSGVVSGVCHVRNSLAPVVTIKHVVISVGSDVCNKT